METARSAADRASKLLNTKETERREAEKRVREGAKELFSELQEEISLAELAGKVSEAEAENGRSKACLLYTSRCV